MSNRPLSPEDLGAWSLSRDIQVVGGDTDVHAFRRPEGATALYVGIAQSSGFGYFDINPKWMAQDNDFTVTAATDVCNATSHGYETGDGPYRLSSTTTLPAGLDSSTDYWVYKIDDDNFYLCASLGNATRQIVGQPGRVDAPIPVDITDTGTGTHTVLSEMDVAVLATGPGNGTFRFDIGSSVGGVVQALVFSAPEAVTVQISGATVILHIWWV